MVLRRKMGHGSMFISLLTSLLLATSVGDITWEKDYAPARARAQEEGRILFVSVLADDEARAEQFWDDVYSDRRVRAFSEETVNLVACLDAQEKKRCSCAREAGLSRDEARYLETAIRDELLAKNSAGIVASPQHLWFSPAGELLQCVVFEMTADEMVWCFVNARRRAGLKHDPMPEGLRAPLRLLTREPYTPTDGDTHGRALTSAEVKQELKAMRASMWGVGQAASFVRLAFTDDKDAQEYVYKELQSGVATWGGSAVIVGALHTMGLVAPASGWEIFEYYADHKEARVRNECAVGLEQLGASDGLKIIKKMLRKEKDEGVKKNWLRALASCGRSTSAVRKQMLGLADRERDTALKANILFALGWLDHHEDGAVVDLLAGHHQHLADGAVERRVHMVLHLHGLEHDQGLAGCDDVAHRDPDVEHDAGHGGRQPSGRLLDPGKHKTRDHAELDRPPGRLDQQEGAGRGDSAHGAAAVHLDVDMGGGPAVNTGPSRVVHGEGVVPFRPVRHVDDAVTVAERHLLVGESGVAPTTAEPAQHTGVGPVAPL